MNTVVKGLAVFGLFLVLIVIVVVNAEATDPDKEVKRALDACKEERDEKPDLMG